MKSKKVSTKPKANVGMRFLRGCFSLVKKYADSCSINPNLEEQPVWKYLWHVLALAFVLRAIVALSGDFILHPDEIMQHYEPAHQAVFGNGILYWEFFHGARSWLVPGLITVLLWIINFIGLGEPWFYINFFKLFFCAFSLLIPWGLYTLSRNRAGEDVARVILIVLSLWPFLIVYAHKPFTEFISTNLMCASLGLAATKFTAKKQGIYLVSLLLALAALVRFQYSVLAFIIWLFVIYQHPIRNILFAVLGGLTTVFFVGVLETATWGWPFHSYYLNFMFNLIKAGSDAEVKNFFLPRLLVVSGGLIVITAIAAIHKPFRYPLPFAIVCLTFIMHFFNPHKEIRFLYLILPLGLFITTDWLCHMIKTYLPKVKLKHAGPILYGYAVIFAAIIFTDSIPTYNNRWLHDAQSKERGEITFLTGHSGMWEIYRNLATNDNVKGVLHHGDSYFNTPGYYYLHKKIPFYDVFEYQQATFYYGNLPLNYLVSHVVSKDPIELDGFNLIVENDYYLYETTRLGEPVATWDKYTVIHVGPLDQIISQIFDDIETPPRLRLNTTKIL